MIAAAPFAALAQPAPGSSPLDDSAVISLSEFVVAGSAETGWTASNSLSGTRTNIELANLPRSVQVMTSEFLADIGALTLTDATDYMAGVATTGNQDAVFDNNTYSIRGFRVNRHYRDGVVEPFFGMVTDAATFDRVEVLKGPSSLLAGVSEPGGLINFISKRPRTRAGYYVRALTDSRGMYRGEIDANLPLTDRAAVRVVGVHQRDGGWRKWEDSDRDVVYLAYAVKLGPETYLNGNFEYIDYRANPAVAIYSQAGRFGVTPLVPWSFNVTGPEGFRDHQTYRFNTEFSHRFNSRFSLRVAANHSESDRVDRRHQNTQIVTRTENGVLVPDRINWAATNDDHNFKAWVFQSDLVGRFEYLGLRHQAVLGLEYIDQSELRIRDNALAGTAPGRIPPFIFGAAEQPGWRIGDRALYTVPNQRLDSSVERKAISLTNLFETAQERLHFLAGARIDRGDVVNINGLAATPSAGRQAFEEGAESLTLGALYRPTRVVSLYGSYSESYSGVPASSQDPFGRALTEPISGESLEFGVKLNGLANTLSLTVAAFDIKQFNETRQVSQNELIELGLDPAVVSGARFFQDAGSKARGFDAELVWQPVPSYQVQLTYTNVDAVVTDNRQFPALVGKPPANTAGRQFGGLFHRFEFQNGPLKGLMLTNGISVRDGRRPFNINTGTGIVTYIPGYTRIDAGVSYKLRLAGHQATVGVRVHNLTDEEYYEGRQSLGTPRTWTFHASTRF
jgi:iron complex outermembrane receptor protein